MSTEENDKLARAYADLRADIARSGPGLVKVFRDQLTLVLDSLEPVKEAPNNAAIKRGDTVELVSSLEYYGTHYPAGLRGTVTHVYNAVPGNFPYTVKIEGTDVEINFNRPEIRKAV